MLKIMGGLLLAFVFAIPWEYSLDLGWPFGNIARLIGVVLVVAALPAVLARGSIRRFAALHWTMLALLVWFCCTLFWTSQPHETATVLRSYAQQMMVAWFVWEFVESDDHRHLLMLAWLAGSWVLAVLTIGNFLWAGPELMEQIRFAPVGHDPNDVARFLGFAFPIAAMLADEGKSLPGRLLAFGYFPVGFAAILLTASRSGFAIALVALGGCALLLVRRHPKSVVAIAAALVLLMVAAWASVPRETLDRIETISDQLQGGDLNQRVNIWSAGWSAFLKAPFFGHGMGTFVSAAGVASDDTAHNTALALAVEGGLCGLALAFAVLAAVVYSVWQTRGSTRIGLGTAILVWVVSSQVATVGGNRATWLLFGLCAVCQRIQGESAARDTAESPSQSKLNWFERPTLRQSRAPLSPSSGITYQP